MKPFAKLPKAQLAIKANAIRKDIVDITVRNGAGHIAPSLSCVDILTALYYRIMNIYDDPECETRDRLVFSKSHGCYGVYAILSDLGFIARQDWETFYKGSHLSGCLERDVKMGIEAGCGALGHGLPMAVGLAFGAKFQKKPFRVYCIVGDGEMQEGSNWEAIQFAARYGLANLTLIIDRNKIQAMDFTGNILDPRDKKKNLETKLKAFDFEVKTCKGHDAMRIAACIEEWVGNRKRLTRPQALIADTVKGYGLLCMENVPKFHFRIPTDKELMMGNRYE